MQASFFTSLASSSLTLFGLVFTLCLIGTQLIATRTNVKTTRIFGIVTWLYLILFLVTTLWTLAISYYAGNSNPSPRLCSKFAPGEMCISEVGAGRWSIFGLSWSLLLLLPFVIYVYSRLSPKRTFSALVGAALRARTEKSLKCRCRRLSDEIISAADEPRVVAEGLGQLLEFGALRARRERSHGSITADEVARCVTEELIHLNYWLINEAPASKLVLNEFQRWMSWLLLGLQGKTDAAKAFHAVSPKQVGQLARKVVLMAGGNLYRWENSEKREICAHETVKLVERIVQDRQASDARIRVSFSRVAAQLASSACTEAAEGLRGDFNLAFRSLIKLCEAVSQEDTWDLGGREALKEVTGVLISLSKINAVRADLSSWTIADLHKLTDALSLKSHIDVVVWTRYLQAISALKEGEVVATLAGPESTKLHDFKGVIHSHWQYPILEQLKLQGRSETLVLALVAIGRRWTKDRDLDGLITLSGMLATEYVKESADSDLRSVLITVLDIVRNNFRRNPSLNVRDPEEWPASESVIICRLNKA